jgi:hypothetical protein
MTYRYSIIADRPEAPLGMPLRATVTSRARSMDIPHFRRPSAAAYETMRPRSHRRAHGRVEW